MKAIMFSLVLFLFIFSFTSFPQPMLNHYQAGVTIENIEDFNEQELADAVVSLQLLPQKTFCRLVFNLGEPRNVPNPEWFEPFVSPISSASVVMGLPLDAGEWYDLTVEDIVNRYTAFADYPPVSNYVDIWEIGNEVNGDWLLEGDINSVMNAVYLNWYEMKVNRNKKVALTFYLAPELDTTSPYEMFTWINAFVALHRDIVEQLDYVFISYYEDDHNGIQPIWFQIFSQLNEIFPSSKLGIGECGTTDILKKAEYIDRYYRLSFPADREWFINGGFWWYYRDDCIPYTKPLWTVMYNAICDMTNCWWDSNPSGKITNLQNYPNPFNPVTNIIFKLNNPGIVRLNVYDILGREIKTLLNEYTSAGNYSVTFDASGLASGIYFYRIIADNETIIGKMVYTK